MENKSNIEEYDQNTETYIYNEQYPFRNIKTSEFVGGCCWDLERKRVWYRNMNPVFDKSKKYWDFIKVLKSTTSVVHWLIKLHHQYFVISQSKMYQLDEVCSIFESNQRGLYDTLNPIAIYRGYIDLESAADRFSQEYMAMLINLRDPDVNFLFKDENKN